MSEGSLVYERLADGVVGIRLHRPQRRNAVDLATVDALITALQTDPADVALLGSATPGIFCAGADLRVDADERARVSDGLYACYEVMMQRPAPIFAVLEGAAVGGGAQLATAADLRIAAPGSWLRWPGPEHGLAVGTWILPALVGRGRALELSLTGRRLPVEEGLAIGAVTAVADKPWQQALELARGLRSMDAAAVTRTRELTGGEELLERLRAERASNADAWSGSSGG